MIGHDVFDRTLTGWFEAEALAPAPAGGLDRVLDATRRRGPRPALLAIPGSHWVGEGQPTGSSSGARPLPLVRLRWSWALILMLILAAIVGGVIVVGARLLQPTPLPAGRLGHLAYDLDGDIVVADWDGRNPVRIANWNPGGKPACQSGYGGPVWSPDGRYLAYRCRSASESRAFTKADGTVNISDPNGNVLASFAGVGDALSWSPDSTQVATWVDWDSRTIGIYGLDGKQQALLALPPGFGPYRDEDPVWSRDGESLLISLRPDPGGDPRQTWELPVDGRTPRPLPADDPRQHEPVYSPDGTRMASTPYSDSSSLVIADADGAELRVLPGAALGPCTGQWATCGPQEGATYDDPVWSPAGDRIAFTWSWSRAGSYYDKDGNPLPRPHELRVVDVASGKTTTLAADSGVSAIEFSPEGDRILFLRTDADGVDALWSVNADGSDAQPLVAGTNSGDWQLLPADR
jgi:Tol biopolymer transport system component